MPDIILFGATGYTGRLTARALAERDADFGIAGRDPAKLEAMGRSVGRPPVFVAEAGDTPSLVRALEDAKVLISCVGPFVEYGRTAVEAALLAGVHYIDSTGEGPFIGWLIANKEAEAQRAGIAMAPAMGFDEVPADVVATMAGRDMTAPSIRLTYALPRTASTGTRRSSLGIMVSEGPWVRGGRVEAIRAGQRHRWAPMPDPLGPRRAVSFPFAVGHLAPRHIDLMDFETYVTVGEAERRMMPLIIPGLRALLRSPARGLIDRFTGGQGEGPDDEARARGRWTILGEAEQEHSWCNVTLTGTDVYGLTASLLAMAGCEMAKDGYDKSGVLSPVQAMGLELLVEELERHGVRIDVYAPT